MSIYAFKLSINTWFSDKNHEVKQLVAAADDFWIHAAAMLNSEVQTFRTNKGVVIFSLLNPGCTGITFGWSLVRLGAFCVSQLNSRVSLRQAAG